MSGRHPYLDVVGPIALAHRGGGLEAPENTLASFAHAVSLGYRYIETDLQATRDGVLLVFHDDTLPRLTGWPGRPGDYDWAELRAARIQGEPIPRFEAVLASWPDLRFNLDPKTDAAAEALADALPRLALFDRICIGSFSDARLRRLRRRFGDRLCTSAGPGEVLRNRLTGLGLPLAGGIAARCFQVPHRHRGIPVVVPSFLRAAHDRGRPVHVWTVDDEAEMAELLDLGVDGLITDRPSVLAALMRRRGRWP
ncbi:glycerophosphodiester phosphodiesterase family protein [Oleisolibacter albus]|uniref:glycerophosphodiester phosphodiesterase family protein n=1 Tax=Oleisolibacter albus TaxID=2171757 RepID=UPI000DF17E86|nr:glycerophosphodiester phosphodiesterase family protein [Oleisolibacter albus]